MKDQYQGWKTKCSPDSCATARCSLGCCSSYEQWVAVLSSRARHQATDLVLVGANLADELEGERLFERERGRKEREREKEREGGEKGEQLYP